MNGGKGHHLVDHWPFATARPPCAATDSATLIYEDLIWIYDLQATLGPDPSNFRMMPPIAHARKWGGWLRWAEP